MGVEFNLFAATETEAAATWPWDPLDSRDGVRGKGACVDSIASLYTAISRQACSVDDFEIRRTLDDNERLLVRLPESVRSALASISISQINVPEILARWSRTDGFEYTGWDNDTATTFLLKLGEHLRANPEKSLFIWISC